MADGDLVGHIPAAGRAREHDRRQSHGVQERHDVAGQRVQAVAISRLVSLAVAASIQRKDAKDESMPQAVTVISWISSAG